MPINPNFSEFLVLLLAVISVLTSLLVVTVSNPVYAVLALIFLFFVCAFLFLLLGAEFIGFIYILVYIGAVLILFLWVVMTMPIKRNVFVSLKLPFILLFVISLVFLSILGSTIENTILVIRFTPDSPLFSAFVSYLKTHAEFHFDLNVPKNSAFYSEFLASFPFDLSKYDLRGPLPSGNFVYDIFVVFASQSVVVPCPIDLSSAFVFQLHDIYVNSFGTDDPIERLMLTCRFYGELYKLTSNPDLISVSSLDYTQPTFRFLLLPQLHNAPSIFSLVLPSFINPDSYLFVQPSFLNKLVQNSLTVAVPYHDEFFWFQSFKAVNQPNLQTLALTLYGTYGSLLLIVGLILLGALVGTVALVKFQNSTTKVQNPFMQISRALKLKSSDKEDGNY